MIKLTYFDIEGTAEKVRLAMVVQEISFEDERIQFNDWPILLPKFGELPVMTIGGGEPIRQTSAMLRYIGRLGDGSLYPQEPLAQLEVEETLGLLDDLNRSISPSLFIAMKPKMFGYTNEFIKSEEGKKLVERLRTEFITTKFPEFAGYLTRQILNHGGCFLLGSNLTIADCALFPFLSCLRTGQFDHIPATMLNAYPELSSYYYRFLSIPSVSAWYAKK